MTHINGAFNQIEREGLLISNLQIEVRSNGLERDKAHLRQFTSTRIDAVASHLAVHHRCFRVIPAAPHFGCYTGRGASGYTPRIDPPDVRDILAIRIIKQTRTCVQASHAVKDEDRFGPGLHGRLPPQDKAAPVAAKIQRPAEQGHAALCVAAMLGWGMENLVKVNPAADQKGKRRNRLPHQDSRRIQKHPPGTKANLMQS